jgi:peptidoglycan/LPS O-acetylase OafA/YrhL
MLSGERQKLGYQPALDGLRALSVMAVIAYHADLRWIPGGFLGVEVFFVVSGYLITALMLDEHAASGRISLAGFYRRRARRLLPALLVMLAAACFAVLMWRPDAAVPFRRDLPAALLYGSNWWQLFDAQGYFAALGRPPVLRHLWSLAIEEQWYLLWPLLLIGLLRLTKGATRALTVAVIAVAAASATAFMVLWTSSDPDSANRVYLGTDTRASGLLLGAALALSGWPNQLWRTRGANNGELNHRAVQVKVVRRALFVRQSLPLVGAAGMAALIWLMASVDAYGPTLYRGAMLATSLASVAVVAAVVSRSGGPVRIALGWKPLVLIGERSYGLYLFHWPIFVLLRRQDIDLNRWVLLTIQLAATAALTELSLRYVERPVRERGRQADQVRAEAHVPDGWVLDRSQSRTARRLQSRPVRVLVGGTAMAAFTGPALLGLAIAEPYDPVTGKVLVAEEADLATGADTEDGSIPLVDGEVIVAPPTVPPTALTSTSPPQLAFDPSDVGTSSSSSTPAGSVVDAPPLDSVATSAPVEKLPPRNGPLRVVVVGDSQARSLVRNVDKRADLVLLDGSLDGCGIFNSGSPLTAARWRRGRFSDCGDIGARWAKTADAKRADVALVMLGAWDVFDRDIDGVVTTFASPAFDEEWTATLESHLAQLKAAGVARAVLLEIPCFRPVDGGGLVALPERGDDARTAHLNELQRTVANRSNGFAVMVEGPDAWCDGSPVASDLAYRWDGVHYYEPGAALVVDAIAPALLAL